VSASVNLPLHHKVQSSLLAPAHPGGPGKRAVKWLSCGRMGPDPDTVEACRIHHISGPDQPLVRRKLSMCPHIGSWPSDHYFRSVCLFVQSFSQPSLIGFRSNLDICYMSGSNCVP